VAHEAGISEQNLYNWQKRIKELEREFKRKEKALAKAPNEVWP
jgi:hypothetical protein